MSDDRHTSTVQPATLELNDGVATLLGAGRAEWLESDSVVILADWR